ncbi:hypothetical protein [Streptomyces cinereoruber]|uniref:hypothetical protein n=1 Tax=Streptomyces cinereoruber TaxID=67260 RepID=UPI003633049B
MTTPQPPAPTTADVDQALAERAADSGQYLAGLISTGMLHVAGRPEKVPTLLFPDIPAEMVDRIWPTALAVGYWLGKVVEKPRLDADGVRRLKAALAEAGYEAMAGQAARSLATAHTPHPADTDTPQDHP